MVERIQRISYDVECVVNQTQVNSIIVRYASNNDCKYFTHSHVIDLCVLTTYYTRTTIFLKHYFFLTLVQIGLVHFTIGTRKGLVFTIPCVCPSTRKEKKKNRIEHQ